ncbi:MAG: hypothetical protein L0H53_03410 [Candidatus Nitrosocosmicus sp.]|nr:hypothetical protein [Candidatus Nitrosocosmicus sp.]MDN5866553.1 hypothetical protein [Candidatus Nitrosocosmicus sp.]
MKDLRNRINKKINKNYNQRQKILTEIKQNLDIDFNKISIYSSVIEIFSQPHDSSDEFKVGSQNKKKTSNEEDVKLSIETKEKSLFRIDLPDSIIGSQRFYYKDVELSNLTIEELNNLKKDLDFILKEIEKEIDKLLI